MATGEVGYAVLSAAGVPDLLRRRSEPADRACDRARQIERQEHRDTECYGKDLEDVEPDRAHAAVDLVAAHRHQERAHDLLVTLDGHAHGEHQALLPPRAHGPCRLADQGLCQLRIVLGPLRGRFPVRLAIVATRQPAHHPAVDIQERAGKGILPARRRQLLDLDHAAGTEQAATVREERAVRAEKACPGTGRFHQTAQHLSRLLGLEAQAAAGVGLDHALAQRAGHDLALGPERL